MRTTRRAIRAVARPARRLPRALLLDILICLPTLVLFSVGWPTLHVTHTLAPPLQPVLAAVAVGPLVLLRANPALGWAISALTALVMGTLVGNQPGNDIPWQVVNIIALIVLVFGVALRMALPVIGVVWASTVLLFVAYMPTGARLVWPVVFSAVVAIALLIRWLALSRRQLARQEEVSELERARRAVLEEKAQIARDLHDVVAHHMSLVVVQAQSAPYRLTSVSDEVRAEFESIGATAREALNEIRGLLGVLRSDGVAPEHTPQPRAADIGELLESTRRAGVDVSWEIDSDADTAGDATGMVAYRIVQESLANASRHAAGAPVTVRIERGTALLGVVVANGPGAETANTGGPGHGIDGMRERALSVGGLFTAELRADGGFEVRAQSPGPRTRDARSPGIRWLGGHHGVDRRRPGDGAPGFRCAARGASRHQRRR